MTGERRKSRGGRGAMANCVAKGAWSGFRLTVAGKCRLPLFAPFCLPPSAKRLQKSSRYDRIRAFVVVKERRHRGQGSSFAQLVIGTY